jgi:HK97 family phage prohead protease
MTETVEETYTQDTETAERPFLVREFAADLTPGDGRTVDVRIVPYGVAAEVSDNGRTTYREQWDPGCFDDQLVAGHRLKVLLNFEHLKGISNIVGKGVELRSMPDGLHGSFRMDEGQDGDKALRLVNDGILDGVSLEAYVKKSVRTADGVVRRVKAHLQNVALCRRGAFAEARVLAVREQPILDEALVPVDLDPETVERCRRLGIEMPQRYAEAHPDETDTPSESEGTPEDGTRPETT